MPTAPDLEFLDRTRLYRPLRSRTESVIAGNRWSPIINSLLAAGYSFMPCRFSDDGWLFRGLQSGLDHGCGTGSFGYFDGNDEMAGVEQAMGVYFLTNELSDAMTVSRLYDSPPDGGIVALHASVFNQSLDDGRAAVLAVGDGGIVFRYPFLTAPLEMTDIARVFVTRPAADRLASAGRPADGITVLQGRDRRELETSLQEAARHLGISAAMPRRCSHYPVRQCGDHSA